MELTAAVEGLTALREPCEVEIVTDSQYVKNGITKWIANWKRNGWRTADKEAGAEPGPVGRAGSPERASQDGLVVDEGPRGSRRQ